MKLKQSPTLLALGALLACTAQAAPEAPTARVILVGDSTLAPHNGYGDALCQRFKPQVTCLNLAKNGRSSGSYRAEGSWKTVQALLANNAAYTATYVLIEFGHNDQPGKPGRSTNLATEFPANLAGYIADVRASGAEPVLVTPLTRRSFEGATLVNNLQPWADADRAVATAQHVPLVDLLSASAAAVQAMGSAEADTLAVEPPPAQPAALASADPNLIEPANNAKSAFDHTHVGPKGAQLFAGIVAQMLGQVVPALAPLLRPENRPTSG